MKNYIELRIKQLSIRYFEIKSKWEKAIEENDFDRVDYYDNEMDKISFAISEFQGALETEGE